MVFICQEGLAIDKFRSLIELQKTKGLKLTGTYSHYKPVEYMQSSMIDELTSELQKSKFVALISDESIGVAILKKLIISNM